ncbi:MAG: hypothetical protein DRP78_01105, partial [Candidatus Omnitrophota bacterium]
MLKPLQEWICDTCGEIIRSPHDGYVEWLSNNDKQQRGFRIVHHARCSPKYPSGDCYKYINKHPNHDSLALEDFVSINGLILLLDSLDKGSYHDPDF